VAANYARLCDIDPSTHNLDPAEIEQMITPRTFWHSRGPPLGPTLRYRCPAGHRASTISDYSSTRPTASGVAMGEEDRRSGDAEIFSFLRYEICQCGEGGAVVTNDDARRSHPVNEELRVR
jgi:hypothetical protein